VASLIAATHHTDGAWGGVALALVLLVLPEAVGVFAAEVQTASSVTAGALIGTLVLAATLHTDGDMRAALAGATAALGVVAVALQLQGRPARLRTTVAVASVVIAPMSYALLVNNAAAFAHVNAAFAVVSLGVATLWRLPRGDALSVRSGAAVCAVVFATAAVDIQLHLDRVTTPEAYVLTPAIGMVALGVAAMLRWTSTSSWSLTPGLVLGLLPTVYLALGEDRSRQAIALGAAAVLVVIGAQMRVVGPLAVGGGTLSLVVLRLVGPEVKRVPEWVALGVVGVVLLVLGATWEQRMLDARRAAHAIRPRIAALR
jgi:hypothetical protein